MDVEDYVSTLRQQSVKSQFCWLVCFEERPLQGIPPRGRAPHLPIFSSVSKAEAFIAGRQVHFGIEPLSVVCVDTPETLKILAISPSRDGCYAASPCGVVMDFDYTTGTARKVLGPMALNRALPRDMAKALGLTVLLREPSLQPEMGAEKAVSGTPVAVTPSPYSETTTTAQATVSMPPAQRVARKFPARALLITGGILGALFIIVAFAILFSSAMRGSQLPVLSFFYTPTWTPTITMTPTPPRKPISTPTALEINITDDFSSNRYAWPSFDLDDTWGSSIMVVRDGALTWDLKARQSSLFWSQYPTRLPILPDFDVSIDIERISGSPQSDAGLLFRYYSDTSLYDFLINDDNQTFSVWTCQKGIWEALVDWTSEPAIRRGQVNRLGVAAHGSHFVFYINGKVVAERDHVGNSSGRIGLALNVYNAGDSIKIRVDNLELQSNR